MGELRAGPNHPGSGGTGTVAGGGVGGSVLEPLLCMQALLPSDLCASVTLSQEDTAHTPPLGSFFWPSMMG